MPDPPVWKPIESQAGLNVDRGEGVGFTERQGQYLAFIYAYTRIAGRAPAEEDFRRFFRVTPPTTHQMILTLERRGFIRRTPRLARSIELLVPPELLPILR